MSVGRWNQRYAQNAGGRTDQYDPWIDRWKSLFPAPPATALDLGCGAGFDTATLGQWGYRVTAIDFSETAVALSRQRNPKAAHFVADLREISTVLSPPYEVAVASLSLHYFSHDETLSVFESIHQVLRPGALFAFRVNAYDEDGAPAEADSWELTTSADEVSRQFFTLEKINEVLGGHYLIHAAEKMTVGRYGRSKSLFEVIARRR
jgi:SAM-dependent methyltransferase